MLREIEETIPEFQALTGKDLETVKRLAQYLSWWLERFILIGHYYAVHGREIPPDTTFVQSAMEILDKNSPDDVVGLSDLLFRYFMDGYNGRIREKGGDPA